jgi:hypothetical protein
MVAGTSVQLAALVRGGSALSWKASAGRITAGGLYTAPARRPSGGAVVLTATTAGARDRRTITIVPAASPKAAPSVPLPTSSSAATNPPAVTAPQVMPFAGRLAMTARAGRAGRLTLTAYRGQRRVGECTVQTPANRSVTCLLDLRGASPATLTSVWSSLRARGRVLRSGRAVGPLVSIETAVGIPALPSGDAPSAWVFTCGAASSVSASPSA